jgi:hypothetical protein
MAGGSRRHSALASRVSAALEAGVVELVTGPKLDLARLYEALPD